MKKRIDHTKEAARILQLPTSFNAADEANSLAYAQVHATLALVEQQRIANQLFAHTKGGDSHLSDADYFALFGKEKPDAIQVF